MTAYFDRIYATDLRYIRDCWQLCGDAHCCNFTRYKSKFAIMGRTHFQELPLLPSELEYLERAGYLAQFGDYRVRAVDFPIAQGVVRYRAIVSKRPGCACDHATRPTICRLYPLFPRFHESGAVQGYETVGIYEEIEGIAGLEKACRIDAIPADEMDAFMGLATHIGTNPAAAFHMEAFRLAKAAAADAIRASVGQTGVSPFNAFEMLVLTQALFDVGKLRASLEALASRFAAAHGPAFQL